MLKLTKGEERIMLILWAIEKGFIKDIQAEFPDPKPPYNSVSTIVRVLVKKDIVSYRAYGGSYQYYPLLSKKQYRDMQMDRLLKNYFSDSLSEVLHYFCQQKKVDKAEVNASLLILEAMQKKTKKSGKKKKTKR
ncbi:MAG: transcriptional regulator [Bacteroidetes bacterium]|nr:MAG: transcriptional regulator [Bacteroidota bacterium]